MQTLMQAPLHPRLICRCAANLSPFPPVDNDGTVSSVFHRESTPIAHKWTFFTTADGGKPETWDAGRHVFPFSLVFPGYLPESITLPYANVAYQLKATLRRSGIMPNISASWPVTVKRDLAVDGSFGTGAVDVENRWRDKLDFHISTDADTFTPGDKMHAKITFQPLAKHMRLTKVGVVLKEYVRCHRPMGDAEKTVSRMVSSAEIVPRSRGTMLEDALLHEHPESAPATASTAPAYTPFVAPEPETPEPAPLLPNHASKTKPQSAPVAGIELTHAIEETLSLSVPNDPRRLQYDHLSSYIEVTHKLKFAIHFRDPAGLSHTLWISVPVSVVPIIIDTTHGPRAELPTYAKSSLDQRVAVPTLDPLPPTYDSVIANSVAYAANAQLDSNSSVSTSSSCSASVHSNDTTASESLAPPVLASSDRRPSHSHTRLVVDNSRPLIDRSTLSNFLRRPVLFPASAEATPVSTPHASPISSPSLKDSDESFPLSACASTDHQTI
ncbi:hypothetical protein LPJ64_003971 [Coemansia asiatica]|uniref:Arrestin C-terminal-like domain-containing protein n=1 Tax=Coemansia asiatica TaxID=1052880 RepID=A0A9W8CIB4_9FUNG|nr:hypothetical protein LPJ64_003971 [Coemansia asiatica]